MKMKQIIIYFAMVVGLMVNPFSNLKAQTGLPAMPFGKLIISKQGNQNTDEKDGHSDNKKFVKARIVFDSSINNAGTISGNSTVCINASSTLTTNGIAGGMWGSNNSGIAIVNSYGEVTGIAGGNVTISYTVYNGTDTSTAIFQMQVNPLPTVAPITGSTTPCINSSKQLSCATPGGVWSNNGINGSVSNTGLVSVYGPGSFTVYYTVTDVNGCTNKSFVVIVPNPLPTVAPITGSTTPCINSSTQLSCATPGGVWSNNGINGSVNSTGLVSV